MTEKFKNDCQLEVNKAFVGTLLGSLSWWENGYFVSVMNFIMAFNSWPGAMRHMSTKWKVKWSDFLLIYIKSCINRCARAIHALAYKFWKWVVSWMLNVVAPASNSESLFPLKKKLVFSSAFVFILARNGFRVKRKRKRECVCVCKIERASEWESILFCASVGSSSWLQMNLYTGVKSNQWVWLINRVKRSASGLWFTYLM